MVRRLLTLFHSLVLSRPGTVIGISAAVTVIAVLLATQVEFRSSRSELAPANDPDQRRWDALIDEYRGSEVVIACVEAAKGEFRSEAELRRFADRLAAALRREPRVDTLFHRLDLEWLLQRALHLLPESGLPGGADDLAPWAGLLDEIPQLSDLARLNRRLASSIRQSLTNSPASGEQNAGHASALAALLGAQRRFLEDPAATLTGLQGGSPLRWLAGERLAGLHDGYLATHDGSVLFLVVSPRDSDDSLAVRRELLGALRARADAVLRESSGFRVGFTGQPAQVVEEMDTVRSDTWLTSVVAVLGVSALTLLVFRWRSHAVLVLLALAAGLVWSFGAVLLELGYLNMITSSFISTLVGVGVAYGIHPVSEYELQGAHTQDPVKTVRESFRRTGPGVAVAAITTAAAFFSIQLMRFRGFAELGLVAGFGVLLCLAAATATLPALLVVYGRWRRRRDSRQRGGAAVDRVWVERLAGRICLRPRTVAALGLAVTAGMGGLASGLGFDTNILDLLPSNSEALRYQRAMAMESDLSPLYNIVVADDLDSLERMRSRALDEPSIARFESALDFLPGAGSVTPERLRAWGELLDGLRLPGVATAVDPAGLAVELAALESALDEALESAFVAGMVELVGPLEEARAEVESSAVVVTRADAQLVRAWNDGQQGLLEFSRRAVDELRQAVRSEAPTPDNLPRELRQRFFTRSGKPLGFLIPAGSVFDRNELAGYVAASQRVSPEVTGFPLVFHRMSLRITSGFYRAVMLGALLVAIILLIDYRNLRDATLALVPLAMGVVWMMGGMRLLGISFNFANLVAVPLIIGIGIDNGVHVIHRVRFEGREGMHVVLRHTGRAILIASLTTMIGFGSLALAHHRGLASLGLVLLLGVGSCLITSTVFLPNLLVVLGLVER